jgi:hypothetical protein
MHLQLILVLVSLGALVGCAYPKTVRAYDEECQIVAREMVLDVTDPNASRTCGSNGCVGQLVLEAAVLAASTVVSGSIVVVGNVVYWLEKKRNCKPKQALPEPAPPAV